MASVEAIPHQAAAEVPEDSSQEKWYNERWFINIVRLGLMAAVSIAANNCVQSTKPQVLATMEAAEREKAAAWAAVNSQYRVYEVQPGDTLSGIADSYDIDLQTLASINGMTDNLDLIFVGQDIFIPNQE
jgi:spore germination protein YaaH